MSPLPPIAFQIWLMKPLLGPASTAQASAAAYGAALAAADRGTITTEIVGPARFYAAEDYHQQYLVKPGSRPYCSAQPTGIPLEAFDGSDFLLPPSIWQAYDWSIPHCVLRGDNQPIPLG